MIAIIDPAMRRLVNLLPMRSRNATRPRAPAVRPKTSPREASIPTLGSVNDPLHQQVNLQETSRSLT